MIGIFFSAIGTLLDEAFVSFGKKEVIEHKESLYTMGFFSMFWGFLFFVAITAVRNSFVFKTASLVFLIPRVILDILQNHAIVLGSIKADRTTYGFVRILTIPLLLGADVMIGYPIKSIQILGILIILVSLSLLLVKHDMDTKGVKILLFTSINAAVTLSLYKYNITHFNSVEAENIIDMFVVMAYFFIMALKFAHENPLRLIARPVFFSQSFVEGFAQVFMSFAYAFAPASVIATAIRAFGVMWATISGSVYFHERHIFIKIVVLLFLIGGLVLLAL